MAVEAISWGTRAVSSRLFTSVTYVKCLNYNLMINISKKKKSRNGRNGRIQNRLRLNERFQRVKRSDMKLC